MKNTSGSPEYFVPGDGQNPQQFRGLRPYNYLMRWREPRWFKMLRSRGIREHDSDHPASDFYRKKIIKRSVDIAKEIPDFPMNPEATLRLISWVSHNLLSIMMSLFSIAIAGFAYNLFEPLGNVIQITIALIGFALLLVGTARVLTRIFAECVPERYVYVVESGFVVSYIRDYVHIPTGYITYDYYLSYQRSRPYTPLYELWRYTQIQYCRFEELRLPEAAGHCLRLVYAGGTEVLLGLRSKDIPQLTGILQKYGVVIEPPVVRGSFQNLKQSIKKQKFHTSPATSWTVIAGNILSRFQLLYRDLFRRQPDKKKYNNQHLNE